MNSDIEKPFFFSVIIPTYNREKFLIEAINSVLNQTFKDFELIIVDDASSDITQLLLDNLLKTTKNMRVFYNSENKGVSFSRNVGIEKANGQFIAFLDSDDLWTKDKLIKQSNFFKHNPSLKFVHSNEKWVKNGKHLNQKKHHKKSGGFIFDQLLERCIISPSTVAMHYSIFNDIGMFDTNLLVCEDYDLWLRVQQKYELGFISEDLIIKRGGHNDQLSEEFPFMDTYRIKSLVKILKLTSNLDQKKLLKEKIIQKVSHLYQGAQKHSNHILIEYCQNVIHNLEH